MLTSRTRSHQDRSHQDSGAHHTHTAPRTRARALLGGVALALCSTAVAAQSSDDLYNRAYVLENESGDYQAAAQIYGRLREQGLAPETLAKVEERLAICNEEIACADFAGLMPENPLFYVELNRPGDQLQGLLSGVGLLQLAHQASGDASPMGISPALVQGILGMRGAAVAITGVNPSSGQPTGVGILHPGDLELVRGLIETALPSGAQPVGEVGGFPTYSIDGEAFVTLTKRMVIASSHKREIRNVLERLSGNEQDSLAGNAMLTSAMGERQKSLLTFCLNPAPLVPLARMAAAQEPEAAMVMALCDPASFKTVVGRLGVQGGVKLDLALNMAEGHENLLFDFLRMPPIQTDTLKSVPAGAAFFTAASLNPVPHYSNDQGGDSYISFMDLGRELFGNIASYAIFGLPPGEHVEYVAGMPMPDVGVVLTVNNPDKTRSLWQTALGVASLAAGAGETEEIFEVRGVRAQRFALPEGANIFSAVSGHELHLASTRRALESSLVTGAGGKSVLDDKAMQEALARVGSTTNAATLLHAGRCLEIGRNFASEYERDEIERLLPHMARTTGGLVVAHDHDALKLSVSLADLPNVGQLMAEFGGGPGGQHGHGHDHDHDGQPAH